MKPFIFILSLFVLASCGNKADNAKTENTTSKPTEPIEGRLENTNPALLAFSEQVMACLKKKDWVELAKYTSSKEQILFYPYGFIDTSIAKSFAPNLLAMVEESGKKVYWANYDGSGEPMDLTVKNYVKQYINDKDYVKADTIRANKMVEIGNSPNNIDKVFKNAEYVEYFVKGTGATAEHNWSSLRLVYRKTGEHYFLIGVIHNQWTT